VRVLITGASSGFGHRVAERLRERGDAVLGLDLRSGPGVLAADVRDQTQVDASIAEAIESLGGLDVLINNAGVGEPQDSAVAPLDGAVRTVETNFLGTWRVTSAAMPALVRSNGRVINVASGLAHIRVPFAAAYCASKTGVAAYSDVLRLEYGGKVGVTTVYPGYVRTPIHARSEQMGLSLGAVVPEEPLDAVVDRIVKATRGRIRRDLPTTFRTGVGIFCARHFPRTTERVVSIVMRRLVKKGVFPEMGTGALGAEPGA
jgi:NAD(P)-dependent dehydrogenase (short-subunit alcohol dehydrogenase family)